MIEIQIEYDINKPEKFKIKTNAKTEAVTEILEAYVQTQIGEGKDDSPPNIVDIFQISITLDLSDDCFEIKSNCGNKGLRDGIILDVIKRISNSEKIDWIKD